MADRSEFEEEVELLEGRVQGLEDALNFVCSYLDSIDPDWREKTQFHLSMRNERNLDGLKRGSFFERLNQPIRLRERLGWAIRKRWNRYR